MNEEKQYKLAIEYLRQPRESAPNGILVAPWVRNLLIGFIDFLEQHEYMKEIQGEDYLG